MMIDVQSSTVPHKPRFVQGSTASTSDKPVNWNTERSSNTTELGLDHRLLEKVLRPIFVAARREIFEDGMESIFSGNLLSLLEASRHSEAVYDVIGELILSEQVSMEVASEALRWIGRIDDHNSKDIRRYLLEDSLLQSLSSRVKDAAGLGLASLDDPKSIPALQKAIDKETVPELRENLEQVLEQLNETESTLKAE